MKGKIQTVLGLIEPDKLGVTLTHEHLLHDLPLEVFRKPMPSSLPSELSASHSSVSMENLGWIRQYPYCFDSNNAFSDASVRSAILEEMKFFKLSGGNTIVDNGSVGLRAKDQAEFLRNLSAESNVNIVLGTGFYVSMSQTSSTLNMTQEQMAEKMREDILNGVDGTMVKCGVIGEVGVSWPLEPFEKRSIRASAIVQQETGCPVIIHPGRDRKSPEEIVRIFQETGGKVSRVVMSHLDRTLFTREDLVEFAALGTFCEFDLFGIEVSHYQHNTNVDMPSDAQRVDHIHSLIKEGYGDKIVVSHDIHTKHRLMKYGGHGFSHIIVNVLPKMLNRGLNTQDINKILISNPKSWLTFQ
ncbi:phosphotriesterase-related protein-like [Uloborus diversus]|uniref:phosphotriesterase-related protein-like n=1 Tax=Uloborus diversus TaxID=327109 RepID=UPI00240A4B59|nr:phosphotriesterase-related protein-like [Uloborus diversus]